ncbi:hypothetical protein AB3U99_21085 [Niallia sp. JL1B1071]|uniref:hypothetical protein n=1 Tax=Niallia tiangongensis TaxID=3237105 RepID=UPI0037DC2209
MKKRLLFIPFLLFLFSFPTPFMAREEVQKYFGVNATVEKVNQEEYVVKTKGEKKEEGFIYTLPGEFSSLQIQPSINLKGNGNYLIIIQETNARGTFINEKKMPIELTDNWQTFSVPYKMKSTTSQIDVKVLTTTKTKSELFIK